eukprot:scaffold22.g6038.t1
MCAHGVQRPCAQVPLRLEGGGGKQPPVRLYAPQLTPEEQRELLRLFGAVCEAAAEEAEERRFGQHVQHMRWNLVLVDAAQLQRECGIAASAVASPGAILLSTGAVEDAGGLGTQRGAEGIQRLLAHEVGHVMAGHGLDSALTTLRLLLRGAAPKERDGADGGLPGPVPGVWLRVALELKQQESEADEIGAFILARAGVDPRAAADHLEQGMDDCWRAREGEDARRLAERRWQLLEDERSYKAALALGHPPNAEFAWLLEQERARLLAWEATAMHPSWESRVAALRRLADSPELRRILEGKRREVAAASG